MLKQIKSITRNPSINLMVGLIFLATGIWETWSIIINEIEASTVGSHHGAIIFGLFQFLKHLPEFVEGLEYIQKSEGN